MNHKEQTSENFRPAEVRRLVRKRLIQVLAVLILIYRTAREDRFLQTELDGYRDYTRQTRYRLLPGVW